MRPREIHGTATVVDVAQVGTDRHPFPTLGSHWSRRRPSHRNCSFVPFPPRSPDPGAPRCEKQVTAVDGPDAATTPRNTHPTLQSGRCSRDIACLNWERGPAAGVASPPPPFCHGSVIAHPSSYVRRSQGPGCAHHHHRHPARPHRICTLHSLAARPGHDFRDLGRSTTPKTHASSYPYNLAGWTGCPFLARSGFPSLVPSLLR